MELQAKQKNVQQREFARGHPPHYYFAGKLRMYRRSDGFRSIQLPMVVRGDVGNKNVYECCQYALRSPDNDGKARRRQ